MKTAKAKVSGRLGARKSGSQSFQEVIFSKKTHKEKPFSYMDYLKYY